MIPPVIEALEEGGTTLVFCNTRSQTEIWYQAILDAKPEWRDTLAIHHGSLDRDARDEVEKGLKEGSLRAVICTSSLDLGVDFSPVDRVLQVGSPKGVARLLQRAGRSGHTAPASRAALLACRLTRSKWWTSLLRARPRGRDESRAGEGVPKPLDVLSQHLVTIALGGGFESQKLFAEVRTAYAYRDLTQAEWDWTLDFVVRAAIPSVRTLSFTGSSSGKADTLSKTPILPAAIECRSARS